MDKKELRKLYRNKRNAISEQEVETWSIEIANQIIKLPIWNYSYFHVFLSIVENKEVNTEFVFAILQGKNKISCVSKSNFETNQMTHYLLTEQTIIKKNSYNIPEPISGKEVESSEIEVVFIPLLAFDKQGNRVGYGKGFYDIFLSNCKPNVLKIGLSYFDPEDVIEGINSQDIPMDYCITPKNIYCFKN